MEKIGLWSGRLDPCHLGHVLTLLRLTNRYSHIHVVVLDFPDRETPLTYCVQQLQEIAYHFQSKFSIHTNTVHFGKITKDQIAALNIKFDVYLSGNLQVIRHIEELGIKCEYVERAFEDNATAIRLGTAIQRII